MFCSPFRLRIIQQGIDPQHLAQMLDAFSHANSRRLLWPKEPVDTSTLGLVVMLGYP